MNILDNDKRPILVTGGAGFIGSAIIHALNRRGLNNIYVADFLGEEEKWRNLVPLQFRDYIEADALAMRLQDDPKAFGEFSCVFHMGANSSTTETDARHLIENNYEFTKLLAHLSRDNNWRFVYASSAATYGEGNEGFDDANDDLARLRPINMYAYSKQLFDLYAKRQGFLQDIVGIKYFNIFGPNEYHKGNMRSMVLKGFEQIRTTGEIALFKSDHPDYEDGEQLRDFCYVKDAVDATLYLAETPEAGGIYNVGNGEANTWLRLMKAVFAALDQDPDIYYIDLPPHLKGKYQYYTKAEIGRLRGAGYEKPFTPLEESVKDYVQNYLVPEKHLGDENKG